MRLSREEQSELMRRFFLQGDTTAFSSVEAFSARFQQPLEALLYKTLPLISADRCKAVLQKLLGTDRISLPSLPPFLSSQEVQLLAKTHLESHEIVAARAQELRLAPAPCIFADTNWPNSYFAFVINPSTSALEIWKTDKTGTAGTPLPLIKSWLGKGKDFIWTIYTRPI
jgi:hypothetical protein